MEAKSRPILNTQPVFKPALKILHCRFLGMRIDLRWFTGVRVSPSICFREALGNWAQSQSLDRFGSKLGLRVGAPDLTGVADVSVSGVFKTAVLRAAFEWIHDVDGPLNLNWDLISEAYVFEAVLVRL